MNAFNEFMLCYLDSTLQTFTVWFDGLNGLLFSSSQSITSIMMLHIITFTLEVTKMMKIGLHLIDNFFDYSSQIFINLGHN